MTQILNSYRQQRNRLRKGKKANPHYGCGPVTVKRPGKPVEVIRRFDVEGKPIK